MGAMGHALRLARKEVGVVGQAHRRVFSKCLISWLKRPSPVQSFRSLSTCNSRSPYPSSSSMCVCPESAQPQHHTIFQSGKLRPRDGALPAALSLASTCSRSERRYISGPHGLPDVRASLFLQIESRPRPPTAQEQALLETISPSICGE